jgi:hypothetical protein
MHHSIDVHFRVPVCYTSNCGCTVAYLAFSDDGDSDGRSVSVVQNVIVYRSSAKETILYTMFSLSGSSPLSSSMRECARQRTRERAVHNCPCAKTGLVFALLRSRTALSRVRSTHPLKVLLSTTGSTDAMMEGRVRRVVWHVHG